MKRFIIALLIVLASITTIKFCIKDDNCCKNYNATELCIVNDTKDSVVVYLTLGADTNYVNNVNGIYGIKSFGLQGNFILPPNDTVFYKSPENKGFGGNLSFNTTPQNCPIKDFPMGINIFEFALNNNFKGTKDAQETIDISCVAGVNCKIGCKVDSLSWNAGNGINNFGYFENSYIYDNVGRLGVYPVGCDSCSKIYQPPICNNPIKPSEPQKTNTCNIQRDATKKGGRIYVIYKGELKGTPLN